MPLFPSDFKKFKHISTDKDKTILEHPDKHQITIAHSALSPALLKQLKAMGGAIEADKANCAPEKMAEGGIMASIRRSPLAGEGANATQAARDVEHDVAKKVGTDVRTPEQKAKAAEYDRTHYAGGGSVVNEDPNSPDFINKLQDVPIDNGPITQPTALDRAKEIYNQNVTSPQSFGHMGGKFPMPNAGGGGEQPFVGDKAPSDFDPTKWQEARKQQSTEDEAQAAQTVAAQQKIIADNQARVDAGLPPLPVPNVPQGEGPPMPQQDAGIAQGMPQPGALTGGANSAPQANSMDPMNMLESGYNAKLAGINAQAQAQGAMGIEQQAALQRSQLAQQTAQDQYKQHYDELDAERQGLIKDIQNGHIDPDKYWSGGSNGEGGHSKIAAGIGMILAGFNPTNRPNAAIDFLKHQMDMNLQAQKENLASKNNLLSANMRQFGNLKDAMDMTRIMQHDIMENELQQAAAKATSPLAKAAAMQAAGQLKMESAPMFQQFAMRRALMNMAGNTGNGGDPSDTSVQEHQIAMMRVLNPEMAKEMETRLVPGVGMAKIPVPQEIRTKLADHQVFETSLKDLEHFVKTNTTLIPGTPAYNTGAQKALTLQSMIREGKLGTVYREGEQPLLDKFINSNPAGAMRMMKTLPQITELLHANTRDVDNLKRSVGLPVKAQVDPRVQAEAWAKANPKDPRAIAILKAHQGQ